jgi:gas vesicle protein
MATEQTEVKSRAREAVDQAKERAGERIETRFSESKTKAAETLSGVASTLHSSSQQLRESNQEGASRAMERAAEGVERFANYLQQTNVDDVVDQVHEFARRQPAAFIGGAFALGFIASRFIKAKSPEGSRRLAVSSGTGAGYETSYDTARNYQSSLTSDNDLGSVSREAGFGDMGMGGDGSVGLGRTGGNNAGSL